MSDFTPPPPPIPPVPPLSGESSGPILESDERFASGPWIGFYVQNGERGRQALALRFSAGKISGEGRDPGGDFRVTGTYDVERGRAWLSKIYPTHVVEYDGHAEGNGVWGTWKIEYDENFADRGGFHIWPDASGTGSERRIHAEVPVNVQFSPVEEEPAFAGSGAGGKGISDWQ